MKSALDTLIEELEAGTWQVLQARQPAQVEEATWPPESLDARRRFAQEYPKLFAFLGRKVRTPAGPGTLLQVFAERATVLLDSELGRCSFFAPAQIVPVSWDL